MSALASARALAGPTSDPPVKDLHVAAYTVPTERPESDGTLAWSSTTMVTVHVAAGGQRGFGYTYAHPAAGQLIADELAPVVLDRSAFDIEGSWWAMAAALRNIGRPGIGSMAISAVDVALWDLKARLLDVSLAGLLGRARDAVPVYGSGGFTSLGPEEVAEQLGGWVAEGMGAVKMKIGRDPAADHDRLHAAREAVGEQIALMVDANGAYGRKEALTIADELAKLGVTWFEEPVSSDDLQGLRLLRDRTPAPLRIAAGEYGWDAPYFRRMLDAGAVDVLQADATRCGGITGFLRVAAICGAQGVPLSSHCAPALHLPACSAAEPVVHMEYFHDHVRIEQMLLDGAVRPTDGELHSDAARPGLGLALRVADADQFRVS